ncbi:MAG: helix-turn-helix domain-containing protein [Anaerolinea sp.]
MKTRYYAPEREFDVFDDLMTPRMAAAEFNYSPRTIVMYCEAGRVAAVKMGKQWIISRSSLKKFLQWREKKSKRRYAGRSA